MSHGEMTAKHPGKGTLAIAIAIAISIASSE
jgi:hypothetical protein